MILNLQEKLHQGSLINQKVKKFVQLDGNLSAKNALKLLAKYFEDKICKVKQIQNIPVTHKGIFK